MPDDSAPTIGVLEYRRPGIGRVRRVRSFGEELSKVAGVSAAFVYYGLRAPREKGADLFFLAGSLLWLGICATLVVRRLRRAGKGAPVGRTAVGWRAVVALLFVATLVSFLLPFHTRGRYTCPHGMRWANNQIGVAWSENGGPCGNGPYQRVRTPWRIAKHWYVYRPER